MKKFLDKHKMIRFVLDWAVLLITVGAGYSLLRMKDLSTSGQIPLFINIYITIVMAYVQFIHEDEDKRFNLEEFMKFINEINILAVIVHFFLGFYHKTQYIQIIKPLWKEDLPMIALTLSLYLLIICIAYFLERYTRK